MGKVSVAEFESTSAKKSAGQEAGAATGTEKVTTCAFSDGKIFWDCVVN
jgi:hypothetical protein